MTKEDREFLIENGKSLCQAYKAIVDSYEAFMDRFSNLSEEQLKQINAQIDADLEISALVEENSKLIEKVTAVLLL